MRAEKVSGLSDTFPPRIVSRARTFSPHDSYSKRRIYNEKKKEETASQKTDGRNAQWYTSAR